MIDFPIRRQSRPLVECEHTSDSYARIFRYRFGGRQWHRLSKSQQAEALRVIANDLRTQAESAERLAAVLEVS